jgi:hypothetical protein
MSVALDGIGLRALTSQEKTGKSAESRRGRPANERYFVHPPTPLLEVDVSRRVEHPLDE